MDKIKVIVVDDSAFMRKLVNDIISSSDRCEVVAKCRNGKELLEKVDLYKPDVITLDLEMSVMDGLTTLIEFKKQRMRYKVIMLSSLTAKGSSQTMECLANGAIDFVEKPSLATEMDKIKDELISKIIAIAQKNKISQLRGTVSSEMIKNKIISNRNKINAVVIGASTGGPKALQEVLTNIDGDINVPVFVVQHMPKGFTKAFAERLDKLCKLHVVEAEDKMAIKKNTIYIAPGGYHMTIGNQNEISLNTEPAIWGVRPAVDKLFESSVRVYKGNLISAVLTGMGRDGANGTVQIKDAGGITISEDESTCTIYGMPKVAYETGKVDLVLPIDKIGKKISELTKERM